MAYFWPGVIVVFVLLFCAAYAAAEPPDRD